MNGINKIKALNLNDSSQRFSNMNLRIISDSGEHGRFNLSTAKKKCSVPFKYDYRQEAYFVLQL